MPHHLTSKQTLLQICNDLSEEQIAEVLDFALFLQTRQQKHTMASPIRELRTVPASQLALLAGLVAWGGDAVRDTSK